MVPVNMLKCFQAVAGLGKHIEAGIGFEHVSNTHSHNRVVIGNHNSYTSFRWHD
jgi:hypothetical protein